MLKAVIFDLDGVVADSHPIHEVAWKALLAEAGLDPRTTDVDFLYAGHPRREILKHYLGLLSDSEMQHWSERKDQLYELAARGLRAKPGIPQVLSQLREAGIACALGTSAGRKRSVDSLEVMGLSSFFRIVITGDDARMPKPAPDIFLMAAEQLAVAAENCLVVEDSVAGIQAAAAAGMKCVGYTLADRSEKLRVAGPGDVISRFPLDSVRYFQSIIAVVHSAGFSSARSKPAKQRV